VSAWILVGVAIWLGVAAALTLTDAARALKDIWLFVETPFPPSC
jgi:hypothetical protein